MDVDQRLPAESKLPRIQGVTLDITEFSRRFSGIRSRGFIPAARRGPTAIGFTLETELGISENNIPLPDLGHAELKSARADSGSLVTLLTFDRGAWIVDQASAIRRYGTIDRRPAAGGRLGLYTTLSATAAPNPQGLRLDVQPDAVTVLDRESRPIAQWALKLLTNKFLEKFPGLVYVTAETRTLNGREQFHYTDAWLLRGTSGERFHQQLKEGNLVVDLRMHLRKTANGHFAVRNHGTGFRAFERNFPLLFETRTRL